MGQMRKGHVAKVCSVGQGGAMLAAGYKFHTRHVIDNEVKLLQVVRCTHGGCLAMVQPCLSLPRIFFVPTGVYLSGILILNIFIK